MSEPTKTQAGALIAAATALTVLSAASSLVWLAGVAATLYMNAPEEPWAVEHQTNIAGKDTIIRCRDASFCPLPADAAALVNAKP